MHTCWLQHMVDASPVVFIFRELCGQSRECLENGSCGRKYALEARGRLTWVLQIQGEKLQAVGPQQPLVMVCGRRAQG